MKQSKQEHIRGANRLNETFRKELVQRITRNLLDVQILMLIQAQPSVWGYRIKKTIETDFHIKLGHGVLYPLLNSLEERRFLVSNKRSEGGRARKVYTITREGERYLQTYYAVIRDQLEKSKNY